MSQGFKKIERLKRNNEIKPIFLSKNTTNIPPIRSGWYFIEDKGSNAPTVKAMIMCPKRNMKHAVDRNRIKRLLKEAYRTQKSTLSEFCLQRNVKIGVSFMFIGNQIPNFEYTYDSMTKVIEKITTQIDQKLITDE